jgi:hypothetical protein
MQMLASESGSPHNRTMAEERTLHHPLHNRARFSSLNAHGASVCVLCLCQDLLEGRPILVLGLLWQIIKIQLLGSVSLKAHPELVRLLQVRGTNLFTSGCMALV